MTIHRRAILQMGALVLLVSACSAATPTSDATDPPATASPTEAATASATAAEATSEPSATATADGFVDEPWFANAVEHRAMIGQEFEYDCPAGGVADSIWGTDTYTDDSSVCTAGVHRGVITLEEGGTVTIEMRPGEDEYEASERNGIESSAYPAWGGSFVIIDD